LFSFSESACPFATPTPRNFSRTISPTPRRPIADVTVP
jgi:hypothetical protein